LLDSSREGVSLGWVYGLSKSIVWDYILHVPNDILKPQILHMWRDSFTAVDYNLSNKTLFYLRILYFA